MHIATSRRALSSAAIVMSRSAGFERIIQTQRDTGITHVCAKLVVTHIWYNISRSHSHTHWNGTRHTLHTTTARLELSATLKNKPDEYVRHQTIASAENCTEQTLAFALARLHTHANATSCGRRGSPRARGPRWHRNISRNFGRDRVAQNRTRSHLCVIFVTARAFPVHAWAFACVCVCVRVCFVSACVNLGRCVARRNVVYKYRCIYILCLKVRSQQFMRCELYIGSANA